MMCKQLICYLLMTLLVVPMIWSQERVIRPVHQQSNANVRQALVIGNSAYTSAGMLRNPVNDARAISNTLSQLGFAVTTITNADQRKMEQSIRDFGKQLRDHKGVGLFYYAGHGMQFDGENYLLPVDINPSSEMDVRYDAVPLGKMLGQMQNAENRMNLVILDACRNNPFARSFRTFNPGLAQVTAPEGTFISFATAPGQVAADGEGNNGLFTSKLLRHLKTPGIKLEEVFKRTAADVYRDSNKQQVPWVQFAVIGDFYFVPDDAEQAVVILPREKASEEKILYISPDKFSDSSNPANWTTEEKSAHDFFYTGEVSNGLPNGLGTMILISTEMAGTYFGEFKDGKANGKGVANYTSGEKQDGYFKDWQLDGHATVQHPDGSKSVGDYENGQLNGQGSWEHPDGRKYIGEWKEGKSYGQGTFTWPDGRKHVGLFKNNDANGFGTHTFPDGSEYVGNFQNDLKSGQGTLTMSNGEKYTGEWKNDQINGYGIYLYQDGRVYVGEFSDSKRHGQGKLKLPNGYEFSGGFRSDQFHGQLIVTTADGEKIYTKFVAGEVLAICNSDFKGCVIPDK